MLRSRVFFLFFFRLVVCSSIVVYFSLPVAYLSTSTIHKHAARIQISDTLIETRKFYECTNVNLIFLLKTRAGAPLCFPEQSGAPMKSLSVEEFKRRITDEFVNPDTDLVNNIEQRDC